MLKKFLLNSLSSFVGAWIAMVLFGIAAFITVVAMLASIGSSTGAAPSLRSGSLLEISLSGEIVETETSEGLDYVAMMQGNMNKPQTLRSLTTAISEAAVNKDVKAIYLNCSSLAAAPATLNALRASLVDFQKKSGKKIYAYADSYSQGAYFVASVADSLFINPDGSLEMQGIGGTSLYFKDLLDKVGVQMQVVKVGTFKSAVEPYILNEMSEPAKAQLDTLYGVMWNNIVGQIAASRKKVTVAGLDRMVNGGNLFLQPADVLLKSGLVDRCLYRREMDNVLARLVDKKKPEDINRIGPSVISDASDYGTAYKAKNQIAVLYATGEIMEGNPAGIDCETLVPQIVKLAEDDNIKGLVLRVNSPGGSVFGSEQIGEALDYFKSKKKPFAVSMGDYAASGGYWISCHADRIFADELTITGSIGIFGLIPNIAGLMQKIGVTPQLVSTNPDGMFPAIFFPMTPNQQAAMQTYIEQGYDKFITRVATGRNMKPEKVRLIAEGRVWNAMTAQKIGLVDELGSLQKSIDWVADKAGISDKYKLGVYPKLNPDFWDIVATSMQNSQAGSEIFAKLSAQTPDKELATIVWNMLRRRHELALMPPMKVRL